MLGNSEDAEDAVQDACVRAHRAFAGFNGGDSRSWFLRIVRNTCYTSLGNRKRTGSQLSLDDELGLTSSDPSPEDEVMTGVDREMLVRALEQLAVEFREIIVMRELEGMSYREIADVSDLPIGTVMSRLARARGRMRDILLEGEGVR